MLIPNIFKKSLSITFFCGLYIFLNKEYLFSVWFQSNEWKYRLTISNTASDFGGTLTNYPLLIQISNSAYHLFSNAKIDGLDILFTESDMVTKLDHEIEYYTNAGLLTAWVKIPSLTQSTTQLLYCYYGYSESSDQQNRTSVWDTNHKVVLHFSSNWNYYLSNTLDSTANGFHGQVTSGVTNITNRSGLVGRAYYLNSNSSVSQYRIPHSPALDLTNYISVEFMVFLPGLPTRIQMNLGQFDNTGRCNYYFYMYGLPGGSPRMCYQATTVPPGGFWGVKSGTWWYTNHLNTWIHTAWTYSHITGGQFFINGEPIGARVGSNALSNSSNPVRLLEGNDHYLDEFRLSGIERSASWIKANYLYAASNSAFIIPGAVEQNPGNALSFFFQEFQPVNQNVSVTISGMGFSNTDVAMLYKAGIYKTVISHTPGNLSNILTFNPYTISSTHGEGLYQLYYAFATNKAVSGAAYSNTNSTAVSFYFSRYFIAPVTNLTAAYQNDGVEISFTLDDTLRAIIGSFEIWRNDGVKNIWLLNSQDKNLSAWKDTYVSYGDSFTYRVINNMTDGTVSFSRTNIVLFTNMPAAPTPVSCAIGVSGGSVGNLIAGIHFPAGLFSADTICSVTPVNIPPVAANTTPAHVYRVFDFIADGQSSFSIPVTISYTFPLNSGSIVLDTSPRRVNITYAGYNDLGIYWWSTVTKRWQLMTSRQEYLSNQTGAYIRIYSDVNYLSMFGVASIAGNSTFPGGEYVKVVNAFFRADASGAGAVTFFLNNTNSDVMTLRIYSLDGLLIYMESAERAAVFSWNGRNITGNFVPNGLYVYYLYSANSPELSVKGVIGKMEDGY